MRTLTTIPEQLKTLDRVLFNGQVTGTGDSIGVQPTKGSNSICILAIVTMANAADLELTVQTGDDADLTNAVDLADNVPIFVNDVREASDGIDYTFTDDDSVNTICFCVPSILIPDGKFIGLTFGNSNDANILSALAIDDAYHESGQGE